MKQLFLFLLLWSYGSFAQKTVTFPDPSEIPTRSEVKKEIQDLERRIIEKYGEGTSGPVLKDCKHPLTLVEIVKQSTAGLEYNFYSEGVKSLIEVITDQAGAEVYRHRTDNITRDRIRVTYNLSPGIYKLKISNADCKAESKTVEFAIPQSGTEEPGTGVQTGFTNPGVYSEKVGGLLYEWIPSENVDVVVKDGRVKIVAPQTKRSFDGRNECRRYLLGDIYDNRLPESEETALFGEGLKLPLGNYTFKIVYLNAGSWKEAHKNLWDMVGVGDGVTNGYRNSAQIETLHLSITDGTPIAGLSSDLWRTSWVPQYQILPVSLNLPENKAFGVTRYLAEIPKDSLFRKITHIQYTYDWITDLSRAWGNQQAYDGNGNLVQPDFLVANTIMDRDYISMSEATENYGNLEGNCPECYYKVERVYEGRYKRFQQEQGVTSPAQTWLVGDYFSPIYGGSFALNFSEGKDALEQGLSSVQYARSRRFDGKWYESDYTARGWYNYRNYMVAGYLGNILSMAGAPGLYDRVYNLEKANLAIPDRKKLTYGTNGQEGLHMDLVTLSGTWYRTKFSDGELLRVDALTHSLHTMLSDAFYALLLGDAYLIWESNVVLNTDPATFDRSWFGGQDDWKTRWKPTGGTASVYVPGENGPVRKLTKGQFPEKPQHGDEGAFLGAKLYESISDRVTTLTYPDFSINNKTIIAKRGKKGQAVSYAGTQNAGQDQIVKLWDNDLPIVMKGTGPGGSVIIYQNPNAGLTEEQGVEVEGKFFRVVGNRLNLIKL